MKPTSVQPWKGTYLAEISRKRKAGETSDLSVKSLPRSVGDLCRRGTPSPLTPPKTTLLTRVLARRRIIELSAHANIRNKNTKIYYKGLTAIYTKICTVQNFPLYGTSFAIQYTVEDGKQLGVDYFPDTTALDDGDPRTGTVLPHHPVCTCCCFSRGER